MVTTREGIQLEESEVRYMYICIFDKFNPENKENREKEVWNPKTKTEILITKYPAPKARKRDV